MPISDEVINASRESMTRSGVGPLPVRVSMRSGFLAVAWRSLEKPSLRESRLVARGTLALRHFGTLAPRHRGTLAPWHSGTALAAVQFPPEGGSYAHTLRPRAVRRQSGFTFIELLVVTTILLILASAVMPLAKVTVQRQREAELRRSLREMRTAIDKYKEAVDNGLIGSIDVKAGSEGYPPDLDTLVEGVTVANDASGRKLKFLRRVPRDPITNSTDWGKRSYSDKPDATTWGGSSVFDVYSKSTAKSLDGTKYNEW
jgi:general secretion pathway protein G